MKKLILFFTCFCFFIVQSFAQDVEFSISGKASYTALFSSSLTTSSSFLSSRRVNDTTAILGIYSSTSTYGVAYMSKIGYEVNTKMTMPLSNKLSLAVGLGFNLLSFERSQEYKGGESSFVPNGDTIHSSINFTFTPCVYTNTPPDVNRNPTQSIINLIVPIEIRYSVIPQKLYLRGGLFLQKRLYSEEKQSFLILNTEIVDSVQYCTYEKRTNIDKSGSNLSKLQAGVSAGFDYQMNKKWNMELGITQDVTNLFGGINGGERNFRPLRVSIGFTYQLGVIAETAE